MKLTPLEIRKQEFRRILRGLDPIEVQTFLEMVAEHYESVLEENKALQRRQIELETQLRDFQENERTLKETLFNVQEVKKQSEASSKKQADLLVKEAELKSLEILENARKQSRKIREEVDWLKTQKESFIHRIRHILVSQIDLLSIMQLDDLVPEETKAKLKSDSPPNRTVSGNPKPVEKPAPSEESSAAPKPSAPEADSNSEPIIVPPPVQPQAPTTGAGERTVIRRSEDKADSSTNTLGARARMSADPPSGLSEEDINNFFKKGIQIDDLIKNLNKKGSDS